MRWISMVVALVCLSGCGASMAVAGPDELPVSRVVLYRNGVGYFERAGQFSAGELEFEVRNRDVGDFLSSLTAVERSGGAVTSVSFSMPDSDDTEIDWSGAESVAEVQARQMARRLQEQALRLANKMNWSGSRCASMRTPPMMSS